jgi:hypothetical protein
MKHTEDLNATLMQLIETQSKLVAGSRPLAPDLPAAPPSAALPPGAAASAPPPPYVAPPPPSTTRYGASQLSPPSATAAPFPTFGGHATPQHHANMLGLAVNAQGPPPQCLLGPQLDAPRASPPAWTC